MKAFIEEVNKNNIGKVEEDVFLSKYINSVLISAILILVAGIMITLAIEVILPKALKYNQKFYLNIGLGIGIILVLINYLLA